MNLKIKFSLYFFNLFLLSALILFDPRGSVISEPYLQTLSSLSIAISYVSHDFKQFVGSKEVFNILSEIPSINNYSTRYIEQATALPSRWSKSLLRDSFSKTDGKFVKIVTLKTKESFFLNAYDYVLCLADKERISVEISYGNNEIYNLNSIRCVIETFDFV